jgi:outer membrane biosynthesis protein TonB
MAEDWTKWESQVINGTYPLRRFLARSNHSVIFLTEYTRNTGGDAAIKLIPADSASAEAQLAYWNGAAALTHPHLIRLFDTGRCQLGGYPFLFVVMEYAEQTLAQILPRRALTLDEVRELLPPTLDALAFLHGKNLVHCRVKPPNFLVVNDQLKLSSDSVRPAQARNSTVTPAGDVWGLGATIVEALTQHPPDKGGQAASLPDTLPSAFADIVRRCLSTDPADRPAIADLDAQFKGPPPTPAAAPQRPSIAPAPSMFPVVVAPSAPAVAPLTLPRKRLIVPASAAVVVMLALAWAGSRLLHTQSATPAAAPAATAAPTEAPTAVPVASSAAADASALSSPTPNAVVHEEIPSISRRARASIRGTIKVTVRVTVDRAGTVIGQSAENRGPSRYFTRVSSEAARKWRFIADSQDSRQWLLQFEFNRSGSSVRAAAIMGPRQ